MSKLFIFLIITIILHLFYSCKYTNKEPFSFANCSTLRCQNNKYSATSMKNTLNNTVNNKLTSVYSKHMNNFHNHLSNFKQQWL